MANAGLEEELSVIPIDQLLLQGGRASSQIIIQPDHQSDLFILEDLHDASKSMIRIPTLSLAFSDSASSG